MSAAKRPRTMPVDLLIVVCNPTKYPLAKAETEAKAVRSLAEGCGKRVEVRNSCTAAELRELLAEEVQPRILLYIGHADARHGHTREFTLGFTDPSDNLELLLPQIVRSPYTVRSRFKAPIFFARVSKNLSLNLGLAAARFSDLNETLNGFF